MKILRPKLMHGLVHWSERFLQDYKEEGGVRAGISIVLGNYLAMHGLESMNKLHKFRNFYVSPKCITFVEPCTLGTKNIGGDVVLNLNGQFEIREIYPVEIRGMIFLKYCGFNFHFYSQFAQLSQGCGVRLIGPDFKHTVIKFDGDSEIKIVGTLNNIVTRYIVTNLYNRESYYSK